MDFCEKHTWKMPTIGIALASIVFMLLQPIVKTENDNFWFHWTVMTVVTALIISLSFPYLAYQRKKRVSDLKAYAVKNNFELYEEPEEVQISIFKEFKSAKIISNTDKFFNLLLSKNDNHMQPIIVTGCSVFGNENWKTSYMTQIFLYKLNTELPKFFVQRKNWIDTFLGERREFIASKRSEIAIYKFKEKKFPHDKYFFFSEDSNIESALNNELIELLKIGSKRKKALINIESDGKNLIFYKQWSRHSIELIDYYSNLFRALKKSLIR